MTEPLTPPPDEGDDSPYDENGVDRSLVRWMLSLSPTERLAAVQSSIDLIMSARELPDGAVTHCSFGSRLSPSTAAANGNEKQQDCGEHAALV
ncbi:MAG TPA: hypothetical protein VLS89_02320 [Candidatus Nanopelagicales bacterium]|nr:hypothetical protein [Candidatus Nanopelagicales bacterium]